MVKISSFEWVVEFENFSDIIHTELRDYFSTHDKSQCRALDVGCGTSSISKSLIEFGFGYVVSIDSDLECIKHQRSRFGSDPRLRWIVHDIINDESNVDYIDDSKELDDEIFDLIIDKATTDALLTQGSIYTMLYEVYRMLKPNGIPELDYNVTAHTVMRTVPGTSKPTIGTVIICRKIHSKFVDRAVVAVQEKEVMDQYFCETVPFLTPEKELKIREIFKNSPGNTLSIEEAYIAMIDANDMLNYDFDMFLEDVQGIELENDKLMNVEEAIRFLKILLRYRKVIRILEIDLYSLLHLIKDILDKNFIYGQCANDENKSREAFGLTKTEGNWH
eukprot:gene3597-7151_t